MRLIAFLADDLEGPVLHIRNDSRVVHFTADQTLCIKNRVDRIHRCLVLCRISNQTLGFGESHPRRSCTVALIVGNDFHSLILPDSNTGISSTQIDPNRRPINFLRKNRVSWNQGIGS